MEFSNQFIFEFFFFELLIKRLILFIYNIKSQQMFNNLVSEGTELFEDQEYVLIDFGGEQKGLKGRDIFEDMVVVLNTR